MNIFNKSALIALSAFALASCGDSAKKDGELTNQESSNIPADGRYYLSAVTVEASDNQGNQIETSPIQVVGENYFWTFKALGGGEYEITATGSAKFTTNNQVFLEWNCVGARDVYVFEISEQNTVRNLRMIETGCPQGFRANDATQLSIDTVAGGAFIFNFVAQGNGVRSVERFTFRKR